MQYNATTSGNFEAEKNRKAFAYTVAICALLLLLFIFITWRTSPPTPVVSSDLIEINLGNNNDGFGKDQPLIKGEMSPTPETTPQQQQAAAAPKSDASQDNVNPDDNAEKDAAPVIKPEKEIHKVPIKAPVKTTNKPKNTEPVVKQASKPEKPLFTYNGPGKAKGNGATQDNGFTSQGNTPGGKGDAGDPSGNPDSYGNDMKGRSGITITKGARPTNMGNLKFEDDFTQNAKVYLDVTYDADGKVVSSTISKGTTTQAANIINIAKRKAAELQFPPSDDGGVSTILLNFKVQN
ncbi:MAG TPA: hypothetical protein VK559_07875 [Ferruginibacter sp.]|nr:hypothetical protein [Ferruginibacter sp.]